LLDPPPQPATDGAATTSRAVKIATFLMVQRLCARTRPEGPREL
jgi:hypothetical protein